MTNFDEKLSQLNIRLEKMVEYQNYFYREIAELRKEINLLQQSAAKSVIELTLPQPLPPQVAEDSERNEKESAFDHATRLTEPVQPVTSKIDDAPAISPVAGKTLSLEEVVGRNLISIVGIIITIIGVGIGAKYAIDNNLISPVMRIIAGYLFGAGLLAVAFWLKPKYLNFSAVLLSGALAILYFITYFAHGFYSLMPQSPAFLLMLLITVGTVAAALNYNRRIIAQIGLVGAYAVPFLLGGEAGGESILLGYVSVVNFGVLAVSLKKYWKSLFYSSFVFSWLIYAATFGFRLFGTPNSAVLMVFAVVFFLTFYATFLAYKLVAKERFGAENVLLLLINSFVFYAAGYALIQNQLGGGEFLGLFTVANAAVHFTVAALVKRYAFVDKASVDLLTALGLIFAVLAVPVELQGNWVTLLWTAQAAILFFVGRSKNQSLSENFAYPLMILASLSLLNDWGETFLFGGQTIQTPILNAGFLTGMLFVAGFAVIYFVNQKYQSVGKSLCGQIARYAIPTILLAALYNTFRIEIGVYFDNLSNRTAFSEPEGSRLFDRDLSFFDFLWQLNYTMLFLTVLTFANARKFKSNLLGGITLCLGALALLIFLTGGLYALDELRTSYLAQSNAVSFTRSQFHLVIRYYSLGFVAALLFAGGKYIKESLGQKFSELKLHLIFDFIFYLSVLWLASSELLNWASILQISAADKLGLSIWWGIYSLGLVVVGIIWRKKHLRVGAIFLFAATLVKLFFYDIAALDTISKTVVFVSLGILLLTISFLYNKYKHLIFDEREVSVSREAETPPNM